MTERIKSFQNPEPASWETVRDYIALIAKICTATAKNKLLTNQKQASLGWIAVESQPVKINGKTSPRAFIFNTTRIRRVNQHFTTEQGKLGKNGENLETRILFHSKNYQVKQIDLKATRGDFSFTLSFIDSKPSPVLKLSTFQKGDAYSFEQNAWETKITKNNGDIAENFNLEEKLISAVCEIAQIVEDLRVVAKSF